MSAIADDRAARKRISEDLTRSFLVEAAAGTGKTTILVARLVNALAAGAPIEAVVAVTFTRKAAGELKLRLRQELDRARASEADPARGDCLADAIARLEEASIGTIHSFCAEILRQRPVEAKIDPAFGEIDNEQAATIYGRAFRTWIERRLGEMPEGLRRAFSRLAVRPSFDGSTPMERLREAGQQLLEWRDYPASWERRPYDRQAMIDIEIERVAAVATLYQECRTTNDPLRKAIAPAEQLDTWIRRSEDVEPRGDYDALEARLLDTLRELRRNRRQKGRGAWPAEGISRADVARQRDTLIASLEEFERYADADLAALLRGELGEVVEAYGRLKRDAGQLDFLDLLIRTRDLIRDNAEVRCYLQGRFRHIFVDEFQDTDPLQVEILLLLAAGDPQIADWTCATPAPGKLFLVGDPKQSIYRFRRADVVLYEKIKETLQRQGVAFEKLTRSWRSVRPLQESVNCAFGRLMTGDRESGQPDYVPLANHRPAIDNQPAVVALPVPEPYGRYRITKWEVDRGLPEVIGAWISWLLTDSDWKVDDPDHPGELIAIRSRHIALLFRRFLSWRRDVTRPYLAALEARGIPHLLSGGRSFHQREEVETLRAALSAVEWPDDELSVFATLKGGLFAIPDAALLRFRQEIGGLYPFRRNDRDFDAELAPIGVALSLLAELHRGRNRVPIAQTILELLEATRAHAGFAMRPAGNQVLANVQRVCDLARAFELRGGISFRGFVRRLNDEAERAGSTESPVLEEGAEGVRVMTVHGAKGLEFPVVILADITANLTHATPSTHIDSERQLSATRLLGCSPWELTENADRERARDAAEAVRVAYVAATRARDLLVVPTIGDHAWEDGWTSPLNPVIYPPRERYRRSELAPGCPAFGERTVLARPHAVPGEAEISVRPGLHVSDCDTPVVWWDPALLAVDVPRTFGLHQELLLADNAAASGAAAAAGAAQHDEWRQRLDDSIHRGSQPERTVVLVSEVDTPPDVEAEVVVGHVERVADRPGGRRFGTLVHTVLRDVPYDADEPTVAGFVRVHGRTLGAVPSEMEAAAEAVCRALQHPLLSAATRSPRCYREVPFTMCPEAGQIVEGVIDLIFGDGHSWTIVDFKTDARTSDLLERYRAQALWYVHAARSLLDGDARAVLLSV